MQSQLVGPAKLCCTACRRGKKPEDEDWFQRIRDLSEVLVVLVTGAQI